MNDGTKSVEEIRSELVKEFVSEKLKKRLAPREVRELERIVVGTSPKVSAFDDKVSIDSVRSRRKNLYRKLDIGSAEEIVQDLLARALKKLVVAG